VKAPATKNKGARQKFPQVERSIVQLPLCLGIPRQQYLKAAIVAEAIFYLGPYTPSRTVFTLKQGNFQTTLCQSPGTSKPRQSCPNHHHVAHWRSINKRLQCPAS